MKRFQVVVPWNAGLHLRPAVQLVKVARRFRARLLLSCGEKIADMRSVLSIIALCATMGVSLEVTATGEDEYAAAQAVEEIFAQPEEDHPDTRG